MKIIIEKENDKYFAVIRNIGYKVPKKLIIKKSWDSVYEKEEMLNYDIFNKSLDIVSNEYDLINFRVEIPKIPNFQDYLKINIVDENDNIFPFFIDYNTYYQISNEEHVYFYELLNNKFDIKNNKYSFYILGNYGDKHLLKIDQIVNKKIFFKIPQKDSLMSELYYFSVEENGNRILKDTFGLYLEQKPFNFLVNLEDFGEYYKCNINTKHKYNVIKELSIIYEGKEMNVLDNYSTYLFIPKTEFKKPIQILIKAKIQEKYINSEVIEKQFLVIKDLNQKEQIQLTDFNSQYDFLLDTYFINWSVNTLDDVQYKIKIGNNFINYSKLTNISVNNFIKLNNGVAKLPLEIHIGINNKYFLLDKREIENPHFIYKSQKFTPEIDYSNYVNSKTQDGTVTWTIPPFKYYSLISIEADLHKPFLDENLKPWLSLQNLSLEKTCEDFQNSYPDLEKLYKYDFYKEKINGKELLREFNGIPKNSSISYLTRENKFIFLGSTNSFSFPKWFINNSKNIKIKVKILDSWFIEQGSKEIEFSIPTFSIPISDNDVRIIRNQNIQFGESGTIGNYDSIKNAGPIEVEKFYSSQFKTYLEEPLFNPLNTDFNNKSLYYYVNGKEGKTLNLKIRRSSNYKFYKIKLVKGDRELITEQTVKFLGDNFDDNVFKISRNLLQEEGEYSIMLKTVNPYEIDSETKTINFFVYNEKPKNVIIKIPENQHKIENGKIIITKKHFMIDIINNSRSNKYPGWEFKEVHFYFKNNLSESTYNSFPDYVVQTSKENGNIKLINKVPFAVGSYKCKIVSYDYAGNSSDPYEFEFELLPAITVEPEKTLTNKIDDFFKWNIKKAEDSDGFFYALAYSPDGVQDYQIENFTKISDTYYVNNDLDKEYYSLKLRWLKDEKLKVKLGYYKLLVNELNYREPEGVLNKNGERLIFESPVVMVKKTGNISLPIYSKNIDGKVKVFNQKKSNEYSYTTSLNSLEFSTLHDEILIETDETDKTDDIINGKFYKLELIPPSKNKVYKCRLPIPKQTGTYIFNEIATKCNITDEEEGVWELRFITRDKYGNSNETIGYYSYKIILIKREPKIVSVTPTNTNGSEYFSLNSNDISFVVDTFNYSDIANIQENIDYFKINKIIVNFLSTPLNTQYKIIKEKNSQDIVKVIENLNEDNKTRHNLDGRYLISFIAEDPLGRKSYSFEKTFYIDTKLDYDVTFINENKFYKSNVTLYASCSHNIKKIYYKFLNNLNELVSTNLSENSDVKSKTTETIEYNSQTLFGFKTNEEIFDSNGYKYLVYWVEEESSNITEIQYYNFLVDKTQKLIPIFDYNNKVYYTLDDGIVNITWNSTNNEVKTFEVKLDKVEKNQQGVYEVVESYMPLSLDSHLMTGVGAQRNTFINNGKNKFFSFEYNDKSSIRTGVYMLTVRGTNIYDTTEENSFIFQIESVNKINLSEEIINNKITLSSNKISWKYIDDATLYEVSYDNKNFISTVFNYFFIDEDKLISDSNGNYNIYLRYKNRMGITEESVKIPINNKISKLKTPIIETESDVLIDNSKILFNVIVNEPEKANFIYYSFDKKKWNVKPINGKVNQIENDEVNKPIPDGTYDIFVILTEENPMENENYIKSDMVHKSITLFANNIQPIKISGIENGTTIIYPKYLYLENKMKNVDYFIYLNGKKVDEGYEIISQNLKEFTIEVKAKKHGRDELITLISPENFKIQVFTGEQYTLNISDEKIICNINSIDNTMEIIDLNNLNRTQIVMYRVKNEENWKTLNVFDKLNLENEYEFKIINFKVDNTY